MGLLGRSLKQGSGPSSLTNKVGHKGQSTYTTYPSLRAFSRQRISLSAKGEGCSRGGRSTIACDDVSSSTDRGLIVSLSSLQSTESASHLDCDEVMPVSSALARIRGVYDSSPAFSAPRSVASTGSSVGCPSSSEVSKSNNNHPRGSGGLSGKGKNHTRRSSRSNCDLWRFESPVANSSSEFLDKTNDGSMGGSRAFVDCPAPHDQGVGASVSAPVHILSPYQGWVSISKDFRAQGKQEANVWNIPPIQGVVDNDRVSLDTPEQGTTDRDLNSKGGGNFGLKYSTLHLRDTEDPAKMWLS